MNTPKSPEPTKAPYPKFDWKESVAVIPYRDDTTGRTVGRHTSRDGKVHRFSATGVFIDTIPEGSVKNPDKA